MPLTRRDWLKLTGSASLAASLPPAAHAGAADSSPTPVAASAPPAAGDPPLVRAAEQPMFNLPGQFTSPVKIASVEMLKNGANVFVRTRSTDGAVGITGTKQIEDFIPIFEHLVAPRFIGQDARQLESLIDDVYRANYKLASLPFWCCVAYIEQSLLDMLGKIAAKPVGALLGGVVRPAIPVYLSGSDRLLSAEEEVAVYERGVAATGAKAVKFKIGGRMSRNLDVYPGRTEKLLRLARKISATSSPSTPTPTAPTTSPTASASAACSKSSTSPSSRNPAPTKNSARPKPSRRPSASPSLTANRTTASGNSTGPSVTA